MESNSVDLVVGIDFGMTFSGVAYSNLKMRDPRVVQKWPGKAGEIHNKVPSIIMYSSKGSRMVKKWGFPCQGFEAQCEEWFKTFLDPVKRQSLQDTRRKQRRHDDIPEIDEVRRWYKDYMSCLYKHLSVSIQGPTGDWANKSVEFIFSLPSTFSLGAIGDDLLKLLHEAGFGSGGGRHNVSFGLTEPEAAAVYTLKEQVVELEAGDVMLVCDAGGGTTDVAILEISRHDCDIPELNELSIVEGRNIGSTNIDNAFGEMVDQRLQKLVPNLGSRTTEDMMHSSEYLAWKLQFGLQDTDFLDTYTVTVPGLNITNKNFNCPAAHIERGKMNFTRLEFQSLFDPEVQNIIQLVEGELKKHAFKHPLKKVRFIVLSGGLGSSAYVGKCIKAAFEGSDFPGIVPDVQILVSEDPQLAVVKGLVLDRVQKLKSGKAVLSGRLSRASYGVSVRRLYDENIHVGNNHIEKGYDGKIHVNDQVWWLIKKGDMVDIDKPITQNFHRELRPKDSRKFEDIVYTCNLDTNILPSSVQNPDVQKLCVLTSDLSTVSLKDFAELRSPRESIFKKGPIYYQANYQSKLLIGPADIRFELWFNGRQYMDANRLQVEWKKQ